MPMIFTPLRSVTWSYTTPSTLPPVSTARSTTTLPGFIALSISAVTRIGALRPKTCAAEITTSESPQVFFIAAGLNREIHNNAAGLHGIEHFGGDKNRRFATKNLRGGNAQCHEARQRCCGSR